MSAPLRIGILGAANIVRGYAPPVKQSSKVTLVGVASRDMAKAEAMAKEVGLSRAWGSYESMLADPGIDAVYLPLPNSLHAEWAIKAAQAKKHILCEKPLAVSGEQAKAMYAAASANKVHLVEAYPYLAQPQTIEMRKILSAGRIGKVQVIQASFGFTVPNPATNVRLVADLGGGARFDAGSYPVSVVRIVAGERPSRVYAASSLYSEGLDRTTIVSLEFSNGMLAQVECSFGTGFHRHCFIGGDKGVMITDYINHTTPEKPLTLQIKEHTTSNTPYDVITIPGMNGFFAETESFAALVAGEPNGWTGTTAQESIDIALTIDAISESMRTRNWVAVKS